MDQYIREIAEIAFRVSPNPALKDENMSSAPLTGSELHFSAIEMCYLALEVMTHYQIRLQPQDVQDYGFLSIRSIAACVARKKQAAPQTN